MHEPCRKPSRSLRVIKTLITATLSCPLTTASAFAATTSLLSVTGIALDAGHHLTKVVIRTWGVDVLAVCHIPPVSTVSVDFDISPDGVLTWQASSWHGELDRFSYKLLSAMFLVRMSAYQKNSRGDPRSVYHPASFEGTATIATIQEPRQENTLPLRWRNFSLTHASRCPDPR
jgi:hypothetical protein